MSRKDLPQEFQDLTKSNLQLSKLRAQLKKAERQRANRVNSLLDAVAKSPANWKYEFRVDGGKTVEIKMSPEILRFLKYFYALSSSGSIEGLVECPELEGCANIGRFAGVCHYICKTVARNP